MHNIKTGDAGTAVVEAFKLEPGTNVVRQWVHKRHYSFSDFTLSGCRYVLSHDAKPTPKLQMSDSELAIVNAVAPQPHTHAHRKAQLGPCPCHAGRACAYRLEDTGKVKVPNDEALRRKWAAVLMPRATDVELSAFVSQQPLWINRLHVEPDGLNPNHSLKAPINNARLRFIPRDPPAGVEQHWHADAPTGWKSHQRHTRMTLGQEFARVQSQLAQILHDMEEIRTRVRHGDDDATATSVDLLGMPSIESFRAMLDDYHKYVSSCPRAHVESSVDDGDVDPVQLRWFLDMLQSSNHLCLYYTGEVSWAALMSIFNWMNCVGAMDDLRISPPNATTAPAPSGRPAKQSRVGRRPALTTEQQFVLWIVTYRQLRAHVQVAANLFGVHYNTAWNTYRLWSHCVAKFSVNMMPWLSGPQFLHDTSAEASALLDLDEAEGVVLGDITEVEVCDTDDRDLHAAFRSQKIDRQSVKVLAITNGASYIAYISVPYPGGISEQELHVCEQIAEIIESKFDDSCDGLRLVYNYDRGIEQQQYWVDHRIRIVSADKSQSKQQVFSSQGASRSRSRAVARIHVERTFEQLRNYSGFKYKRPLSELDLAECEVECGRFLVNLKPCNHNWAQVSFDVEADGRVGETGHVSPAGDADVSNMF